MSTNRHLVKTASINDYSFLNYSKIRLTILPKTNYNNYP